MTENVDLFGDPVPDGRGRPGRPQHVATLENRNKVSMLLAFGWNSDRVANALKITAKTLRRHYSRELRVRDQARDRLDAAVAMRTWKEAEAGNMSAMRLFVHLVDRNDLRLLGGQRREEAKPLKLGKKEVAQLEALTSDVDTPIGRLMAKQRMN
jgi:hypothetical protein